MAKMLAERLPETCWYCGKSNLVWHLHHIASFHFVCWIKVFFRYRGNVDWWLMDNSEVCDES